MPAQRVGADNVEIRQFDVIAQDSDGVPHFVRHVGLSSDRHNPFRSGGLARLTHMGPPLQHGSGPGPVHAFGTVPLSADEIQQINVFVDERQSEHQAEQIRDLSQYIIRPYVKPHCEKDGTVLYYRFSCAGFVIEAYRYIGIVLLLTDEPDLPAFPLSALLNAYPDLKTALQNARLREKFNLSGDGPWPVVLAGYVVNALSRTEDDIRGPSPYRAESGDEFFPPRRTTPQGS